MEWEIAYQKQAEDWAQETEGLSTQPGTDPGRPTTPGNRTAALHEVEVLMSVTLVFIFYSCLKRACFSFSRKINQLCIIKMGGGEGGG